MTALWIAFLVVAGPVACAAGNTDAEGTGPPEATSTEGELHLPARGLGDPAWWLTIERTEPPEEDESEESQRTDPPEEDESEECDPGFVLPADLLFAVDSAQVGEDGREAIAALVDELLSHPGVIEVVGHTDRTGDRRQNEELSRKRAGAVRELLVSLGVPSDGLEGRGVGSSQPRSTTSSPTPEDHARDRRVELHLRCES